MSRFPSLRPRRMPGLAAGGSGVFAVAFALALALLCAALAPRPVWAADLVVYSGRGERFTEPVIQAFRKKTGIATQALVADTTALLTRLEEEGDRTEADVFLTNYAGMLDLARQKGLLQPYRSAHVSNVPKEFHGPDDMWIAGSARARVIVYNKALVDPKKVRSMADIARPEWDGKLGITISSNASFIGGVAAMIKQDGEDKVRRFLAGIKRNAGDRVYPSHTPVISAVARGEIALGLVNHYYFYRALAAEPNAPIGIIFPDQDTTGAVTTITGLGITRHARHAAAARQFVDFVLSDEGQKIFAEVNFEFPVNPHVERDPALPKPGTVKFAPVSQALQTEAIDRAVELIRAEGMQ